ncbi:MAG: AAA family ATPase [Gaiellales bacterium]
MILHDWLVDAADLLAEPDPGPTPWLVEGLVVDRSLAAIVGRWKTTKSWAMLELGVSIATGVAAFGTAAVPEPGPVVYVIEESGRKPLQRRLDMLCRGRGIKPERLRGQLFLAANARVKLDDDEWQARLVELGADVKPRAFIFDPLARMKAPDRDENAQGAMAEVIEYLRRLRDAADAAILFVHHTGHNGDHMRGSSDLESAWESRLAFARDGDSGTVTVTAAHREAEDGAVVAYTLEHRPDPATIRLRPTTLPLVERVLEWIDENEPATADTIAKGVDTRATDVRRVLHMLVEDGTLDVGQSGKRDKLDRPVKDKAYRRHGGSSQTLENDVLETAPGTTHDDPSRHGTRHSGPSDDTQEPTGIVARPDVGRTGTSHREGGTALVPRPVSLETDEGRATHTAPQTEDSTTEADDETERLWRLGEEMGLT